MTVPVAGGPAVALLPPGSRDVAISPADDSIVFLSSSSNAPMVADAHGQILRPLSAALTAPDDSELTFSPDGTRVMLLHGDRELIEVDLARGAIVRNIPADPGVTFYALSYLASGPAVLRVRYQGNLFVADMVFRTAAPAD
jgi:hypothetical protein